MKVIITEGNGIDTVPTFADISLVDENGIDILIPFLIDNDLDGNILGDTYLVNRVDYDKLKVVLEKEQELIYRIDELKKLHGSEEVYQLVESVVYESHIDHADKVNDALDVEFTELD